MQHSQPSRRLARQRLLNAIPVAIALLAGDAFGQSSGALLFTWTGTISPAWSGITNWTPNYARAPSNNLGSDFALFPGTVSSGRYVVDLASTGANVRGLRFDGGGGNSYTLNVSGLQTSSTGYGLKLRPDGITNNSGNTQFINAPIRLYTYTGGPPTPLLQFPFTAASGDLVFDGSWTVPTIPAPVITAQSAAIIFDGDGNITIGDRGRGDLTGSGTITKNGAGTLTFGGTASNSFTGLTTVTAGTLKLNKASSAIAFSGPLAVTGGTVLWARSEQVDNGTSVSISGTGALDLNGMTETLGPLTLNGGSVGGGTLTASSYTLNQGSAAGLAGWAVLSKSAAGDLSLGANSSTGGAVFQAGRVFANNGSTGNATGSGLVTVANGATLTTSTGGSVGPVLVEPGGTITSEPLRILVVNGDAVIAGNSSGNVDYQGNLTVTGTISPGNSVGTQTVAGDLTLDGLADLQLAGPTPGQFDQLIVAGTLNFAGDLHVQLLGSYLPQPGDTFDLFQFAAHTGTFANLVLPALAPGFVWDTSPLYSSGQLRVQGFPTAAVPLPAAASMGLILLAVRGASRLRNRR